MTIQKRDKKKKYHSNENEKYRDKKRKRTKENFRDIDKIRNFLIEEMNDVHQLV